MTFDELKTALLARDDGALVRRLRLAWPEDAERLAEIIRSRDTTVRQVTNALGLAASMPPPPRESLYAAVKERALGPVATLRGAACRALVGSVYASAAQPRAFASWASREDIMDVVRRSVEMGIKHGGDLEFARDFLGVVD